MFSKYAISALVAATVASAQSSCSSDTFTITAASDAVLSSCTTLTGNVIISPAVGTSLDLGSVTKIDGSLTADSLALISLQATSLKSITGSFTLNNLTALSTLSMTALTSVGTIGWTTLTALSELTFTAGVETASNITISDTHLSSLAGLSDSLQTVGLLDLNNNPRLQTLDLALTSLSQNLILQANGQNLAVSLNSLAWAKELTIANTTTFTAPMLQVVNGSARFDSNYFTSLSLPNLTKTVSGDVSFINNADMTSLNLPILASVGGGLTIVNNTAFQNLTLPLLADVGGAVDCGGNFSTVVMPELNDVVGTFTVTSTTDISDECKTLQSNAPEPTGNGNIQGKFQCTSNNDDANTGSASGGTSSSGSSSGSSNSSSAAMLHINSAAMGLSFVGLLAQLL